jgi:hypothetical protein
MCIGCNRISNLLKSFGVYSATVENLIDKILHAIWGIIVIIPAHHYWPVKYTAIYRLLSWIHNDFHGLQNVVLGHKNESSQVPNGIMNNVP